MAGDCDVQLRIDGRVVDQNVDAAETFDAFRRPFVAPAPCRARRQSRRSASPPTSALAVAGGIARPARRSTSATTTLAPAASSVRVYCRPSMPAPPVRIATRPLRSNIGRHGLSHSKPPSRRSAWPAAPHPTRPCPLRAEWRLARRCSTASRKSRISSTNIALRSKPSGTRSHVLACRRPLPRRACRRESSKSRRPRSPQTCKPVDGRFLHVVEMHLAITSACKVQRQISAQSSSAAGLQARHAAVSTASTSLHRAEQPHTSNRAGGSASGSRRRPGRRGHCNSCDDPPRDASRAGTRPIRPAHRAPRPSVPPAIARAG